MNKTILVIILVVVLIGGISAYAFNLANEKEIDPQIGVNEDNNEDINNNEDDEKQIPQIAPVDIGELAPTFTLENLDGEVVSLEDYRGKNIIVNFWASWCPPCKEEMPDFQKYYTENKDNDFAILAINAGESKAIATKFMEENGYNFPVLLDTATEVGNNYMVSGIPTSFIIDKEGIIRNIKVGPLSYPEMKQIFEELNKN